MGNNVSNEKIAALCLELSLLLRAGVSMRDALCLLPKDEEMEEVLSSLAQQISAYTNMRRSFYEK